MLTRNRGLYVPNFYNKEKIVGLVGFKTNKVKNCPQKSTKSLKSLINNLNYFIVKNLRNTNCCMKRIQFQINSIEKQFLMSHYKIKCRYKKCNEILSDLNIFKTRHFPNNATCSIEVGSFQIKLNKKRKLKFKTGSRDEIIQSNYSMSIKFLCKHDENLSESERNFLFNYEQQQQNKQF